MLKHMDRIDPVAAMLDATKKSMMNADLDSLSDKYKH